VAVYNQQGAEPAKTTAGISSSTTRAAGKTGARYGNKYTDELCKNDLHRSRAFDIAVTVNYHSTY